MTSRDIALAETTGGRLHITDASNAARTMLYNIHTGTWDSMLLEALQIPHEILPVVCPSSHVYGLTEPSAFLGSALPIAGMVGDQQAALFGQACFSPAMVKQTYGTGGFLLLHTGTTPVPSPHGLLTTVAWDLGARTDYALEGSMFIAGAVFGGLFTLGTARRAEVAQTPAGPVTPPAGQTPATTKAPSPPAAQIGPAIIRQITTRLNLTADQKEKIRPIVTRAAEDLQRLRRENLQDTTRVMERMYADVSASLTPEQRTELEEMKRKMQERVENERKKRGEVPPPEGGRKSPNANAPRPPSE
jgi:sugar (pentulose or hexulose) kinase